MKRATSFAEWNAQSYLSAYYTRVESEERCTLRFLIDQFKRLPQRALALEFGIGPTLHHLLPLSPYASEIHVADLLPENLDAVRKWQLQDAAAHDWSEFTRNVLTYEGDASPTHADIRAREQLTRSRLTRRLIGDARLRHPIGAAFEKRYDCVLTCYCADSATTDKLQWHSLMRNIASLLRPGGLFVVAALRHCNGYRIGENFFPSPGIDERDMRRVLTSLGFDAGSLEVRVEAVPDQRKSGFESVVLAAGVSPHGRSTQASRSQQLRESLQA
ncbi:MAG TPA: guanitoxin biosynthesis pre-guanitoxin forming N-methyltransferase GntF [Steroidobacteraceae bacterium]|nr:guanitoxin biosynthesis pre-guanitoxin forming N-methyltransferase GntF [Steroidobacteraceae bacterium]